MYHVNVNVKLMEENIIQIKKWIMCGILLYVVVKMENIQYYWIIQELYVMKL